MACTATATRSVKQEVVDTVEMKEYVEVITSPDRPNIFYAVRPRTTIASDYQSIRTLREKAIHALRVLIYCQSLNVCAVLYAHFHYNLEMDHIILHTLLRSVTIVYLGCSIPTHPNITSKLS